MNYHQEALSKKENNSAKVTKATTPGPVIAPAAAKTDKGKPTAVAAPAPAPVVTQKPLVDLSLKSTPAEKTYPSFDLESIQFPDLQSAYDLALTALLDQPEPVVDSKDKKDKKKAATPESDTKGILQIKELIVKFKKTHFPLNALRFWKRKLKSLSET